MTRRKLLMSTKHVCVDAEGCGVEQCHVIWCPTHLWKTLYKSPFSLPQIATERIDRTRDEMPSTARIHILLEVIMGLWWSVYSKGRGQVLTSPVCIVNACSREKSVILYYTAAYYSIPQTPWQPTALPSVHIHLKDFSSIWEQFSMSLACEVIS